MWHPLMEFGAILADPRHGMDDAKEAPVFRPIRSSAGKVSASLMTPRGETFDA